MSKTNWINMYGGSTKTIQKFQAGGAMAPEAGMAPAAPEQGGAPDLQGMLAEYQQSRDPQLAVAICDTLVEMMAQGGGEQGGAPMARRGAKLGKAPRF